MNLKHSAKICRDAIQQGIYAVINPFVRMLVAIGVTPNMVTTIGMLGNLAAAALLIMAASDALTTDVLDYSRVTLAGILIIAFSIFDMLDGQVARLGNMASRFGAMYDSILDRYCELFNLGGIAFIFIGLGDIWGAVVTFLAIVGSLMVSYVRARAEGVGIECKMGFMQRPERVVITVVAIITAGLCESALPLWIGMAVIAVFANITAFARINHCRKQLG